MPQPTDKPSNKPLTGRGAAELIAQAADGAAAQLPLDEVFRALADDTADRRLRQVSLSLAERLAAGDDFASALAAVESSLPAYLRQTLAGAADVDQTGAVLSGLAQHETSRRRLRHQLWSVTAYPLVILALVMLLLLFLTAVIAPAFRSIYEDFELELPTLTVFLLDAFELLPWLLGGIAVAVAGCLVLRILPGGARLSDWLRTALPGIGSMWICSGHHELASILGALVRRAVPLDDALHCTVASLRDRNLARALKLTAERTAEGASLGGCMSSSIHFDPTLTALVSWGEANRALSEALDQAREHFAAEIELRAVFLSRILPPLLLVGVTFLMFAVVIGLMLPLVDLVHGLSG